MLKKTLLLACLPMVMYASTISTLLDSLKHRPENKLDSLLIEQSHLSQDAIDAKLMPSINLFGNYEMYTSPTGMVPIPPNELLGMVKDPNVAQPFSTRILRGGASFTWPLFIKSLYTLKEKTHYMHLAAKDKKRLNLLQREALVVGSVAQMRYLEELKHALHVKKHSIEQTQTTLNIKVKDGRAPESALLVLHSNIDTLNISLNTIEQKINILQSKIETLTGIHLTKSVALHPNKALHKEDIFALHPLQKRVAAMQKGIEAADEAYYPSVVAKGRYAYSQGEAYNNGIDAHEHYGSAGLYISMPLFNAPKNTAIEQAKVSWLREKTQMEQTKHTLEVQARQLDREIKLLKHSIGLSQKSVADQKKLLHIAKVSFKNESITQEEYLRYEDALASAKANLYSFEAKKWQDIAQLAVIYGNDLKRIVK